MRVERGADRYADTGWVEDPTKLKVELETPTGEDTRTWDQIAQIDVKYGAKSTIACMYESSFDPPMYMCTIDETGTVKAKDGKTFTAASRYAWQFTFEDGQTLMFYLSKLPARQQDMSGKDDENYALYEQLTADVTKLAATGITRITITP